MTCLAAQKPLWEYLVVFAGFALLTCACAWVVKDQWGQRHEAAPRMIGWLVRLPIRVPGPIFPWMFGRAIWWARVAHRVTLAAASLFGLLSAWIAGAVLVNSIIYAHALMSGMPRC